MIEYFRKPEGKIFCFGFLIMILGFINLFFIRNENFFSSYSFKQFIWILLGAVIFFIVSRIRLQTLKQISIPFYLLTLILLIFVLLFGDKISGAKSWIKIGSILSFQPSELVKISFIPDMRIYYIVLKYGSRK